MVIAESQLETWSHRSQTDTAIAAHESVSQAFDQKRLVGKSSPLWLIAPQTHLQGSYRNYTNIWADSDVDILVQPTGNGFFYDVDALPPHQQEQYKRTHPSPAYTFPQYRQHVYEELASYFGWTAVTTGNKSIQVEANPGERLAADVVPCWLYRKYYSYNGNDDEGCTEGIAFESRDGGDIIVNFPDQHLANGIAKHEQTQKRFKPTVRVFKNARNWLVDNNQLSAEVAPSYFIQCLLYNVPVREYASTHAATYFNVLSWTVKNLDDHSFVCQNGLVELFGDRQDQWSKASLLEFVKQLLELYETGT